VRDSNTQIGFQLHPVKPHHLSEAKNGKVLPGLEGRQAEWNEMERSAFPEGN
jgi:hypothetical protein